MAQEDEKIRFRYENEFGQVREIAIFILKVYYQILNVDIKKLLQIIFVNKWKNIWRNSHCPTCKGYRLKEETLSGES